MCLHLKNVAHAAFDRAASPNVPRKASRLSVPISLSLAGMFPFILDFQIVIGSSERNRRKAPSPLARSLDYDDGGPRGAARARGCKRLKESGSNGDAYHAKANGYLPAGSLTNSPTLGQR